jgi:hypothetical protein
MDPASVQDRRLTMAGLRRLAHEYDALSRGRHWPASEFVEWARLEVAAMV